ncbi:antibiotic biosynthesis monooxygenase family protein [Mycobacterium sp.]|jgi:heme-degrading monooxygenase HmoA|uniref:antibiotic biosynthesis monooxygenase family protein n=1 Tax=Mycobacterium sp. TaxID=1785 RepID=UPI002D4641AE|nr:antibiotic biosynthesis monooxygenase family protein [Mycobacterium sp.]HZA09043.1 antibiotic biosynthesis monooxygenase family protein [Mycobacterium sp.]
MASQPTGSTPVTLINVFEIDPAHLEPFMASWRERAEFMSRQPGFRSFRLHRALSPRARFQLVNVAEWDSADALAAATAQEEFQASAQESVQRFGVTAHPGVYETADAITRPA